MSNYSLLTRYLGANPILQYPDGTTKPQALGTTLAQIRERQGASCWLEDTADSCEYSIPDFILVAGHTYKVLKPDATGMQFVPLS